MLLEIHAVTANFLINANIHVFLKIQTKLDEFIKVRPKIELSIFSVKF